ncbi:hypothetical protein ACLESO_36230 [Pyxidicoccus sp. 3LG]
MGEAGGPGPAFLTTRLVPGAPRVAPSGVVEGAEVAVAPGSVAGPLLAKDGARVREASALHAAPGLRAAWDWQLEGWGYVPGEKALREEKLVWVVPPGENGWLVTVDRFVVEQAEGIRKGLVDQARHRAASDDSQADIPREVQP